MHELEIFGVCLAFPLKGLVEENEVDQRLVTSSPTGKGVYIGKGVRYVRPLAFSMSFFSSGNKGPLDVSSK